MFTSRLTAAHRVTELQRQNTFETKANIESLYSF
jgi:hypothetical protein